MSYVKSFMISRGNFMSLRLNKVGKKYNIVLENSERTIMDSSFSTADELYDELEYVLSKYNKTISVIRFISLLDKDVLKSDVPVNMEVEVFTL